MFAWENYAGIRHTNYMGEISAAAAPAGTGRPRRRTPGGMDGRGKCLELLTEWGGRAQPLTPDGA